MNKRYFIRLKLDSGITNWDHDKACGANSEKKNQSFDS